MRYEIKFKFYKEDFPKFLNWLTFKKNIKKTYHPRKVNNIYYDDIFFTYAQKNITGLANREKYRVRWYGDSKTNFTNPSLEIKIKKNRLNYKKKYNLNCSINNINFDKLFSRKLNYFKENFNDEINKLYLLDKVLFPVMKNSYNRRYYSYNNDVRITLDDPCDYYDILNKKFTKYFQKMFIIEIKFDPVNLKYARDIIENIPFNLSRFSKYIHGLNILKKINFY